MRMLTYFIESQRKGFECDSQTRAGESKELLSRYFATTRDGGRKLLKLYGLRATRLFT